MGLSRQDQSNLGPAQWKLEMCLLYADVPVAAEPAAAGADVHEEAAADPDPAERSEED